MRSAKLAKMVPLIMIVLLAACDGGARGAAMSAATSNGSDGSGSSTGSSGAPKRIVVGTLGVHSTLNTKSTGPGRQPGYDALEALVSAGLATTDDHGVLRPQLAEAVPTIENGLWQVSPDGHMETTWAIKPNAQWQDGAPFTTSDLLFTAAVIQDPALPFFRDDAFSFIDSVSARDDRTLVISWNRPYAGADAMFTNIHMVPLPRHLLERQFEDSKTTFTDLPYWRDEFIGTGPFRLRSWTLGSGAVFDAFDGYVLGRPKVDTVEVKFITDAGPLVAALLAGDVDMTMGRGFSLEQALDVRSQWKDGHVEESFESWVANYPQLINPSPAVLGDVRFRRALVEAIDRQEMVDTIQHGLVPIAHILIDPSDPYFKAIDPFVVKYPYDPQLAMREIENLGYTRGADGAFRDTAGQRLSVEVRGTVNDTNQKAILSSAEYWGRIGVPTDVVTIPPARNNDREYRNTRPGFELQRQPNSTDDLDRYLSSQVPLAENNYTGTSKSRYMNADLDVLINTFFSTIVPTERVRLLGEIVHHISDQVVTVPLYYDANTTMIANRLLSVGARKGNKSTEAWNAESWDVSR